MNEEKKLSTEPYRGVRDFYPEDMAVQNYIFKIMRQTAENFGYGEYSASILEPAELYDAKSGEELASEQTYRFKDKNKREISLRPEMTPTLARMIARKKSQFFLPLRFYSIANVFRYERPQKGRLREHWQLNIDLFGIKGTEGEAEVISLAYQLMKNFGGEDKDFIIKINSRKLMYKLFSYLELKPQTAHQLTRLIDKHAKIEESEFEKGVSELVGNNAQKFIEWLDTDSFSTFHSALPRDIQNSEEAEELTHLFNLLKKAGVQNTEFDPSLTRGLDYYTGIVFEIFDTNPENKRSLFGGGRYDNILDIFSVERVPATGFGAGDVAIKEFLRGHNLLPTYIPSTKLYICTISAEDIPAAFEIADSIRKSGINTAVNLTDKKVGNQVKLANRKSIPFVMFVGEQEKESGKYMVKDMNSGEEKQLTENEVPKFIRRELEEETDDQ